MSPPSLCSGKHLFQAFNKVWIENLHGNRKISEYAPDGQTSETIFAVAGFSPGIQQGVATTLWVKSGETAGATVLFRDDHAAAKAKDRRRELLDSLRETSFDSNYRTALPTPENRYSFWPQDIGLVYRSWPKITDLCGQQPSNGLMEKRGGALIDIDRELLETRMRIYHDKKLDWDAYVRVSSTLTGSWAGFNAQKLRSRAIDKGFQGNQIVRYAVRPLDTRWCYFTSIPSIWNRSRPALWSQLFEGNSFLLTRMRCTASPEGFPIGFSKCLSDDHYITPDAVAIPFYLRPTGTITFDNHGTEGNLSDLARSYLTALGLVDSPENAALLWFHSLAIGYSPAYLEENSDGIRNDWPRIPLAAINDHLRASAALGRQVASLLDTEAAVPRVTAGAIRTELRSVAALWKAGDSPLVIEQDLRITSGWGHAGKDGVTMPGRGKIHVRQRTEEEQEELVKGVAALGITEAEALERLGKHVVDLYLNDACAWINVPQNVWELYIGGYQVIKKWLSYREFSFIKRPISLAEADEVQAMARRLMALCLMQSELDVNYLRVKSETWKSPSSQIEEKTKEGQPSETTAP